MTVVYSKELPASVSEQNAKMFSMTPEEMIFASKLTDENRRLFCYQFSEKERLMSMESFKEASLTADQAVQQTNKVSSRTQSPSSLVQTDVVP